MSRVLCVYGSGYGQTEKVVRRIADSLAAQGAEVSVWKGDRLPAELIPEDYDAFLIGASILGGRHQRYIEDFVRRHSSLLSSKPSAFVSVSGSAGSRLAARRAEADRVVAGFLRKTGWQPWATRTFGGATLYTKYNFLLRWIIRFMSARSGGPTDTSRDHEFTDWDAVDHFAKDWASSQHLAPAWA